MAGCGGRGRLLLLGMVLVEGAREEGGGVVVVVVERVGGARRLGRWWFGRRQVGCGQATCLRVHARCVQHLLFRAQVLRILGDGFTARVCT